MNDPLDKSLHDWVRQSLADCEANTNPHNVVEDWDLLRPRLFPRRQWPMLWFWLIGLTGLMGGLGWYWLGNGLTKKAPSIVEMAVPAPKRPLALTGSGGRTTVISPERLPEKMAIARHHQLVRRERRLIGHVSPAPPVLPEKSGQHESTERLKVRVPAGVQVVQMSPRNWPTVALQTLSPPEQALETTLLSGEIGADSTVFAALSRNLRQWPDAVIVCDLTTSMDPYATQIYAWFRRTATKSNVNGVVFFTDCDSLGQQTRPNGPPGAFFTTHERDPRAALPTLLAAARNTANNRDGDENVVEALGYAQRTFPESKHLILLADNSSGVKDMSLLAGLKKPVHVIACGPSFQEANAFQDDHYQIAFKTGGTMHTLEDDIKPNQLTKGTLVRVGDYYYRYSSRKGRFVKTRFNRRPVIVFGMRL